MAETRFQDLSPADRRDALEVAEQSCSYRALLLEKDIWVVAALGTLFEAPFAQDLTFKGGTSLSKVYGAIRRFSEDVDITYDIRAFAPDLVSGAGDEALPPSRSQEKCWTQTIRARLTKWVRDTACPSVVEGLAAAGFAAQVHPCKERLYIRYETLFDDSSFIHPQAMVEFGARSTGEPRLPQPVVCDAAACLPHLVFPKAHPTAMLAERTFWEKATAIHVFCRQKRHRGERLSRHWHDLVRLDEAGIVAKALADHPLALSVARHKSKFFSEKDACGVRINYKAAVSGELQLVPSGPAYGVLADDYARMLDSGMLLNESEPFDVLMDRCALIEARANRTDSAIETT
ncbi:MAG: nucleotidyl transferase AbiEii/AbiGii toxin family protein [Synechococcus sp. SB0668_bin_15]|nr:nucleotidyl transferase AbiEii/AbiGii toxin family protein [Synechococcus sp. SB0668_bin_15]MXZ83659.1 nucleotidyl transferase AbiEii/AbiGii toxin family protein [Synechococcus sp. SB0666_bin_14]MYC49314.1 nucleotidyl transferase AbiEii/AbiGii toxin family protein [Synechococcus sp. SB0662_bin_14]MYG46959.1 nucleotidyl transferase AbiEii/AbiGii toxin family protein [Synechococcus sp. SB0675_bin_6]MYJ60091.1 nucleotidyl transferase AbiEii/AbiGii toxin family protein [Synechococcus sp. SB0672_